MNVTSSLRSRVDPSSITAVLAVGDLVAITAFVLAGEISHGYEIVSDADRVARTAGSFLVGWAVVSLAGGLYTADAVASVRRAVVWTLPAWALAVVLAQGLRATALVPGNASPTFALVAFAVGGLLLTGWRVLATLVSSRRTPSGA